MKNQKYLKITWNAFHQDVKILAQKINVAKYQKIYAISRGGLAPACVLAHQLNIRKIETIDVVGYQAESQLKEIQLLSEIHSDGENCIVIDDLIDSGRTINFLRPKLPKALFVTVYAKPLRKELVDFYAVEIPADEWILFPWENDVHPEEKLIKIRDINTN